MKNLLLTFLLCFSSSSFSKSYKLDGQILNFTKSSSGILLYNCKEGCDASKAKDLKKFKVKELLKGEETSSSLGSLACNKILRGNSLLGRNLDGDGRDFCIFKDKSMLEINSLTLYIQKNKLYE